jgi:hypothetical protein
MNPGHSLTHMIIVMVMVRDLWLEIMAGFFRDRYRSWLVFEFHMVFLYYSRLAPSAFYAFKKCYMGFCTPRCMIMDLKKNQYGAHS